MLSKIINSQTKEVQVFLGTDIEFAHQNGFIDQEIERKSDGTYYLKGFCPVEVQTYTELRAKAYPPLTEQLDMQYWDRVNGTHVWEETLAAIKEMYPKT